MNKLKFSNKLLIFFLVLGICTIGVLGTISYFSSRSALIDRTYEQLTSIKNIKKNQIETFFSACRRDMYVYSMNSAMQMAFERFVGAFNEGGLYGEEYLNWKNAHGAKLKEFIDRYGYYDLFIISPQGDIAYTVAEEADLGKNVYGSELSGSNLTKAFEAGKENVNIVDFDWYEISDEPASFIAGPVFNRGGELLGVLAFRMSATAINDVMMERTGLGESGETYLIGPDYRFRSDSRFTEQSDILRLESMTENADLIFQGNDSTMIVEDYRGVPVLSSFAKLDVEGLEWGILADMDEAEVMIPVKRMRNIILIVAVVLLLLTSLLALGVRKEIMQTLGEEPAEIRRIVNEISQGNLDIRFVEKGSYLGVYKSLKNMSEQLKEIVMNVVSGANNVSSASQILNTTSQELSQGSNEQASSIEEVSSTMEEIASNIQQNSSNAEQTKKISGQALSDVSEVKNRASVAVQEINKIGKKVKVITEIARQTNILSLNAAIEAAKAGEQGRGFAVVASEVRRLAEFSKNAADDIVKSVYESIDVTEIAASLLVNAIPNIENTSVLVNEIFAASVEQNSGANQINNALQQINNVVQQTTASSEELASSAEELAGQSDQLLSLMSFFNLGLTVDTKEFKNVREDNVVVKDEPNKSTANNPVKDEMELSLEEYTSY